MADKLGVEPAAVVFLDDQPVNVAAAAAVGMTSVPVDVTNPDAASPQLAPRFSLPRPAL